MSLANENNLEIKKDSSNNKKSKNDNNINNKKDIDEGKDQYTFVVPSPIEKDSFRRFRSWKMKGTNLTLSGYSRCRDKTFFFIPEIKVALDAGFCRGRLADYVFLTHGHLDHSYDIGYLCTGKDNMTLYCPEQLVPQLQSYCRSHFQLDKSIILPENHKWNFNVQGCKAGDTFHFGKDKNYSVEIFQCYHSVPCVGYGFSEKRRKIKSEYKDLKKEEIIALRKKGIDITMDEYKPLFIYFGDTNINIFLNNNINKYLNYNLIIIECTFLHENDDIEKNLMDDGHIIWKQLKPFVLDHPQITFLLIHFSCRYNEKEIIQFFKNEQDLLKLQGHQYALDNCIIWACEHIGGSIR